MLSLLGYEPADLLEKSVYDCHHGADSESLLSTFKSCKLFRLFILSLQIFVCFQFNGHDVQIRYFYIVY